MSDPPDPMLTLRIALDSPSAGASSTAGNHLDAAGFKVESVSPRGLQIAGSKSLIEKFFDTRIDLNQKMPQFDSEPAFGKLPEGTSYRAYFPSKPTFF
jgi:hypothetical protein